MGFNWFSNSKPLDWGVISTNADSSEEKKLKAKLKELRGKFAKAVGNPVPYRYEIVRWEEVASPDTEAIVVEVRYEDCQNYDGHKVLLYDDAPAFWALVEDEGALDPHFLEKGLAPVARFEPTERGWSLAITTAKGMI
jgi:hypothetical protein